MLGLWPSALTTELQETSLAGGGWGQLFSGEADEAYLRFLSASSAAELFLFWYRYNLGTKGTSLVAQYLRLLPLQGVWVEIPRWGTQVCICLTAQSKKTTHTQIRIIWELKIILSELWDSMWAPISKGSKTGKHSSVGVCKGAVKTHIHRIKSLIWKALLWGLRPVASSTLGSESQSPNYWTTRKLPLECYSRFYEAGMVGLVSKAETS